MVVRLLAALGIAFRLGLGPATAEAARVAPVNQAAVDQQTPVRSSVVWVFLAQLSGANEVPPASTQATGYAVVAVSENLQTLWYTIEQNVPGSNRAHIHRGGAAVNGPIIYDFTNSPFSRLSGNTPFTATDLADFFAGNVYVNVHSPAYPGGEVRGQLRLYGTITVPFGG